MRISVHAFALLGALALSSCNGGAEPGPTGNTELNLDIVNPGGDTGAGFSIDRVDYRITCGGGSYLLPPFMGGTPSAFSDPCSTDDLDNDGIPDVCPPGSNYIAGTSNGDFLVAGSEVNCVFGFGGNDSIIAFGPGTSHICLGDGNDLFFGDFGTSAVFGENGNDSINGGVGDDYLDGGSGTNNLNGGGGIDTCVDEAPPGNVFQCESTFSDSVDISGAFETIDTRDPPVWQAVMDLPPGDCTITLSVYEDDELVCVGSQTLAINEDETTKYDIVLVCSLSIDSPDGMADVDGTFEYITGNLCPKLYLVNAIPEVLGIFEDTTEIQFRAKDPDNTCGSNCDPQSCTTDNPPICTPYPSNINDPACNAALGGDPNDPGCLAGDYAGLVCTTTAVPIVTGVPGGTFINPQDGVTPVGPVLPVNLNLAAGLPGVILPGLGGPEGTNAANSPAYPPAPNFNGSLPPLVYQCESGIPGSVVISVTCSDGDLDCDQQKQVIVECSPGPELCIGLPPGFCDAPSQCQSAGTGAISGCDPLCDPFDPDNTGSPGNGPPCELCPNQGDPLPDGTPCDEGGGNVCTGGTCVECLDSDNTLFFPQSNPNCDDTPVDCQLPSVCSGNACQPRQPASNGTPCTNGVCSGGTCVFDPIDPCQDTPFSECEGFITVVCGNTVTSDVSLLGYYLISDPDPIIANQSFDVWLGGFAIFDESFLDAGQGAIPGGVTKATVVDVLATVQTRGDGATGPNVPLPALLPSPECLLDDAGPGIQQPCDPANDVPSIAGVRGNTDCIATGSFNPCGPIVELPLSYDCAPGGVCDSLGKASQCAANGFCVNGSLFLDLQPAVETYTAGDGVTPGQTEALFGWYDTPADATQFIGTPPLDVDGTYNVQQPIYTGVSGPIGFAVNAGGLAIQLDCVQGFVEPPVPPLPQDASPSPDALLRSFPVQVP